MAMITKRKHIGTGRLRVQWVWHPVRRRNVVGRRRCERVVWAIAK